MRIKTVTLLLTAAVIMAAGCSVQKNTARSRAWQSFTAKYNTYYNGKQAFIDGMLEKEKGNKDDFTGTLPMFTVANKKSRELGKGKFATTIEKMEKTIKQHSIKARPEWKKNRRKTQKDVEWLSRREYNPFLWKAWLMLGQAQYQSGDFDQAAATFSYVSRLYQTQPAINGQARAWLARCYTGLDWLYDAEDVIRNQLRDTIHYAAQPAWNQTLADYYLRNGNTVQALPYLKKAIKSERRKTQKARLWFVMAQSLSSLERYKEAYSAYRHVINQNPPYEVEFNARIAQTEVLAAMGGNSRSTARKMIGRLKRMAISDKNKDYLDQVYYAIGNIYLAQADTMNAIDAYEKGNEKATRSGTEKGVLLLTLGNIYWQKERYNDAQRCYGEAIGLLDKDRPDYEELAERSKVLDELVPHTDAVHLQDSLQELAKMPEKDRLEAIDRVIKELKRKEKEAADKEREAMVAQAQQKQGAQGNRNTTPTQTTPTTGKDGLWYFYNPTAVNQGKQTFMKQWGKRENADNWQRVNQTVVGDLFGNNDTATTDSIENNDAIDGSIGNGDTALANDSIDSSEADSLAADPHNREYYLAQIPFTEEQVAESNAIIKDGLFNSGVIFKDKLDNLVLSERQLLRLANQYPDYEQMDQVWYHLFLLYSRRGDSATADSCLAHLQSEHPESDYTILLSDPLFAENARFGVHIEDSLYAATYDAFKAGHFDIVSTNSQLSEERFPLGANRPKFLFINGLSMLNGGDAKGCVEQLRQVVEKYPQSEVTEMAGMIVKGVQEGRQLYGGKFDLDDIWSRRDLTLDTDSVAADTLSDDRDVPFLYAIIYQPDSLAASMGSTSVEQVEHQLLYEMARFNFTNFLVRNFDLEIEHLQGFSRMVIRGFLNYDEALQYARQLSASDESLASMLRYCRSIVISEHNLTLIGSRYSYRDYDEFYEQTFLPLTISNEELLQKPDYELPQQDDEDEAPQDSNNQQAPQNVGDFDFDPDFF